MSYPLQLMETNLGIDEFHNGYQALGRQAQ